MKMKFTLIEVIVSIVLLSLLGTVSGMLIANTISGIKQPQQLLQSNLNMRTVCARIKADSLTFDNDLAGLKAKIGTGDNNNEYGKYTVESSEYATLEENVDGSFRFITTGASDTDFLLVKLNFNNKIIVMVM